MKRQVGLKSQPNIGPETPQTQAKIDLIQDAMDLHLTDKIAFVAGASTGLGYATARALAAEGCRVAVCSRDEARITDAAASIAEETRQPAEMVLPLVCDVTDEAAVARAIETTAEQFGALHILVTNAGGPPAGTATSFGPDDWQAALELNLLSTIALCRHATPHLKAAAADEGLGRIIMIASAAAKEPIPRLALSNTARAGVLGYMKSLADDLGPEGITVNAVLPGYTRTERLNDLADSTRADTGQTREEVFAAWAENNALKRIGTPTEFAATVAFLASNPAGYITGTALPIDGGRSKHLL